MGGLFLKDCYTLLKQMRIMLVFLLVFSCMPNYSMVPFAVFYASMLPITALAYDERSKWDELAVMMPYSTRSLVCSKYLLGIVSVCITAIIAAVAQFIIGMVQHAALDSSDLLGLLLLTLLSLLLLSINLPLMFRLGVEKGRIAFLILICSGVSGSIALQEQLLAGFSRIDNIAVLALAALLITVIVVAVSIRISIAVYRTKRG